MFVLKVWLITLGMLRHYTATPTGLVGAFGGLGGFLSATGPWSASNATGAYTWGFIFLAIFALFCLAVNYLVFLKPSG